MERFSISILRQQVYNICRLCGVDNPDKTSILGDEEVICIMESDEPTLAKKIEECVGIQVYANDQMPQNICSLCVDKVNDFYEYRLMCASTNIQTRTFLNLPLVHPSISLMKSEPDPTPAEALDDKSLATMSTQKYGPKTRNRKKQLGTEEPENSAEDADFKSFPDAPSEKRVKYEHSCQYCNEKYGQPTDLERHLIVKHTPLVHKFGCGSCMEYFDTASEYKDHNLWHKLTRTAFGCFRCGKKCVKIGTLNKHVTMNACIKRPQASAEVKIVPDMRCTLCQKVFKTRNLYEWHGCFIRARANCPKCGKYFLKKNLLTRHFMLYCTGSLPLMEPTYIQEHEPGVGPANGLNADSVARGSAVVPKRGRGRPSRTAESMKGETIEFPFPPLLDLPDIKSESNSDGPNSLEVTLSSEEVHEAQKRPSLVEETAKITTLLRSGESVDGNTDIATINSMLSSVNEAIATISKVRKKKKKRDRGQVSGEGSEKANPPMVVLSMANVKQEVHEDSSGFVTLTNSASVGNELNATVPMNDGHQALAAGEESDHDTEHCDDSEAGDNMVEDSFADRNDSDGDSSDAEIISVENYHPQGALNVSANGTEATGPLLQSMQQMAQIKQEPMAVDGGDESDFEGYEDASLFVAVKQEPLEEPVVTEPNQPCYTMEKHSDQSVSSYQALRIKIKKEKGLLNASVVQDDTIEPIQTPEAKRHKTAKEPHKRTYHLGASGTKPSTKPAAKRTNLPHPPTSTELMIVSIKQEPPENNAQLQESVTTEQYVTTDATFFERSMVRIKQEPVDDNIQPQCGAGTSSLHPNNEPSSSPTDIVAFDGMRIKQEPQQQQNTKKAFNPLSLTGVRLAGSKKSANSSLQSQSSGNKSSVMINPFALLKQKENLSTVEAQEPGSKENVGTAGGRSDQFSLPVITQVESIDPLKHLSLTSVRTAEAEPSSTEGEQTQTESTDNIAMDNCDDTDNVRNSDSSPSTELNCGSSESAASNNVPPKVNVSELKIASVTTIPVEAYGCNSQQPLSIEQQHESSKATNNRDDNVALAAVPELCISNEVSSVVAGSCSELAEKDLLPTLDTQDDDKLQDDEMPELEEEPKPAKAAEESQMDHAVAQSAEQTLDDSAVVCMEDEQQERNSSDIVSVESTHPSTIDTTVASNAVETLATTEDKKDVNINASTTTKEVAQLPDASIAAEDHIETPGSCSVVADNDEVLVATEQCTS